MKDPFSGPQAATATGQVFFGLLVGPVQRINSRFPARTAPPCCPDAPPRATRRVLQAPQTQSEWAESKILMIEGQVIEGQAFERDQYLETQF